MRRTYSFYTFLILILSYSSLLSAGPTLDRYYNMLKNFPIDQVDDKGKICEKAAELQLADEFPESHFEIISNVLYGTDSVPIIGELDLVIFDRFTQKATLVVEVKCRKRQIHALTLGKKQLSRFRHVVEGYIDEQLRFERLTEEERIYDFDFRTKHSEGWPIQEELKIYDKDGLLSISYLQFDENPDYRVMSPCQQLCKGSKHIPLDLNLFEVETLVKKLDRRHSI